MKINCLSCGFKVDLNDAYDDYQGQVKCYACDAMLEIKTEEGNVKAVQFANMVPCVPTVEIFERVGKALKDAASEPPFQRRPGSLDRGENGGPVVGIPGLKLNVPVSSSAPRPTAGQLKLRR